MLSSEVFFSENNIHFLYIRYSFTLDFSSEELSLIVLIESLSSCDTFLAGIDKFFQSGCNLTR